MPTTVSDPKLIAYATEVAALFDLSAVDCNSDYFTQIFSGNQLVEGMQPYDVIDRVYVAYMCMSYEYLTLVS
jgi:uncharacterized protein YdiU (UPF0061 family)